MPGEMAGFLGTSASWRVDAVLVLEIGMCLALGSGARLARHGRIRAHGYCQSVVVGLNLLVVAFVMVPSFHESVRPDLPRGLRYAYYAVASVHGALGVLALALALYVILSAGTLLPPWLRLTRYNPWMRATVALWWLALGLGMATYVVWYGAPLTRLALSR